MKRVLLGVACGVLALIGACKTITAPVSIAETPEQKAFALYGTFVIYEELAATVVTDATTPANVKLAIKQVDARAKPLADALMGATRDVLKVKAEIAAGLSTEEKLQIANQRLLAWVTEAQPKILALQCAVNPKQAVCN